ncbi:MAG: hypothetical protein VYE15_06285 [Myxococcota bacterium]|nr:hypothetical protein [Myxococcota bacterium]
MRHFWMMLALAAGLMWACGSDDGEAGTAAGSNAPDVIPDPPVYADAYTDPSGSIADTGGQSAPDGVATESDGAAPLEDSGSADPVYDIEIGGEWVSGSGNGVTITDTSWGSASIVQYDNTENWAVVGFPADDPFNGGMFGRFVWTDVVDDSFYHCPVLQGAATVEEALASTATADATDPSSEGCNSGPWFSLTVPIGG